MIADPKPADVHFMAEAMRLAAHIPLRPWPNPPVGAVVVSNGRVVGRGAHHGPGQPHAETVALDQAGPLARGSTLYVTLEPCNHAGRTPPCAPRIVDAGVRRLVVAIADPNPNVAGRGLEAVVDAGVELTLGVLSEKALDLIWPFAATRSFDRPFVLMKTATSIDGRFGPVARPPGAPGPVSYLTGVAARQDVHRQRRWADVVLVGENTLAADRPRLDGRLAGADQACPLAEPMPAYVDTDWSYAGDWPWQRFVVFGGKAAASEVAKKRIEESGGTVVSCDVRDGHVTPQAVLDAVFSDGGRVVMVEAGPTLAAAFLRSGLVDRWICYTAPSVLGGGPAWPEWSAQGPASDCGKFTLTRVERRGSDVKSVFDRLSFADVLRDLTDDRLDRLQPRRVLTDVHRARA